MPKNKWKGVLKPSGRRCYSPFLFFAPFLAPHSLIASLLAEEKALARLGGVKPQTHERFMKQQQRERMRGEREGAGAKAEGSRDSRSPGKNRRSYDDSEDDEFDADDGEAELVDDEDDDDDDDDEDDDDGAVAVAAGRRHAPDDLQLGMDENFDFVSYLQDGDRRKILTTPTPRQAGAVECIITRQKSGLKNQMRASYTLLFEEGSIFMLFARKMPKNRRAHYRISMDHGNASKKNDGYLGKLRANFKSTEYSLYDAKHDDDLTELAAIGYEPDREACMDEGISQMHACVPLPDHEAVFKKNARQGMLAKWESNQQAASDVGLVGLVNKPPTLNKSESVLLTRITREWRASVWSLASADFWYRCLLLFFLSFSDREVYAQFPRPGDAGLGQELSARRRERQ